MNINEFLDCLSKRESDSLVYNQFQNHRQRNNLSHYFELLKWNGIHTLLLGEASGFNGCRHSGIAFTSGDILSRSILYKKIRKDLDLEEIKSFKEYSANIIYSFFHRYPHLFNKCIIFNSFPFHPHLEGNSESNRKPKRREIIEGQFFLIELFRIFEFKKCIAIGNVAHDTMKELIQKEQIPIIELFKVRHPSYGGKNDFLTQIRTIFNLPLREFRDITSW